MLLCWHGALSFNNNNNDKNYYSMKTACILAKLDLSKENRKCQQCDDSGKQNSDIAYKTIQQSPQMYRIRHE